MTPKDTYLTVEAASEEILYKEKNSKFFGYVFPVDSEDGIKMQLELLRKKHPNAGHFCYAWQLGSENTRYRANDDGEPSNSAGMPIYGQIQSSNITNVLIVVVRYFGGTKLGVGGLISAYRTSAKMALDTITVITKTIAVNFTIHFEYALLNKVMRIVREHQLVIVRQKMELQCEIELKGRKSNHKTDAAAFNALRAVQFYQKKED